MRLADLNLPWRMLLFAGMLAISFAMTGRASDTPMIAGRAVVVDGDGLHIGPVTIRIHGIDAPEFDQNCPRLSGGGWACGAEAAKRLRALAEGRQVFCEALDTDRYGRTVARCRVGEVDLAERLVSEGLAWAYVRYSTDYAAIEAESRRAGRGVWQADAQPPWAYRADRRIRGAEAAPQSRPLHVAEMSTDHVSDDS